MLQTAPPPGRSPFIRGFSYKLLKIPQIPCFQPPFIFPISGRPAGRPFATLILTFLDNRTLRGMNRLSPVVNFSLVVLNGPDTSKFLSVEKIRNVAVTVNSKNIIAFWGIFSRSNSRVEAEIRKLRMLDRERHTWNGKKRDRGKPLYRAAHMTRHYHTDPRASGEAQIHVFLRNWNIHHCSCMYKRILANRAPPPQKKAVSQVIAGTNPYPDGLVQAVHDL